MQTILKHIAAVLSRFIFIGFGVQIVLGILWMCNAFAGLKSPVEGIVCVGAIALMGGAVTLLKRELFPGGNLFTDVWVTLSVLTFPFVMQSLVYPDRRIVIAAILVAGVAFRWKVIKGAKWRKAFGMMVCLWMAFGVLVCTGESLGREVAPFSTRLTQRVIWTTLYNSYARLPEETRELIPYVELADSTYEAVGIETYLIPALERRVGERETKRILDDLCKSALQYNKKQIIKEIFWDAAGYTLSPVVVPLQLSGRAYESYTGLNYRELLGRAPELGKLYTYYSCWWFVVAALVAAVRTVLVLIREKMRICRRAILLIGVPCVGMIVGYTLNGAAQMDYKNTLFVLVIWLIWMSAAGWMGGRPDEKE